MVSVLDEEGDEFLLEMPVSLDFQLTSPSGKTLAASHQALRLDPKVNPEAADIPARGFQIVIGLGLNMTEYGPHQIRATVTVGEKELVRTRHLYVVQPPNTQVA